MRRQNNKRDDRKRANRSRLSHRAAIMVRCGAGSLQEQQQGRVMNSPSHTLVLDSGLRGSAVGRYVASMQDVRIFID